ncbi:MAG: hypothetical protein ACE369_19880 [Roseovarius sp.]
MSKPKTSRRQAIRSAVALGRAARANGLDFDSAWQLMAARLKFLGHNPVRDFSVLEEALDRAFLPRSDWAFKT